MYLAYAATHDKWHNLSLICICLFTGLALPSYSRLSNAVEEKTNLFLAVITLGRISRVILQYAFNFIIFKLFDAAGILNDSVLHGLGGIVGLAFLTTLASQGAQYIAVIAFNRGIGDLTRNVMFALAANILMTAAATTGLHRAKVLFVSVSLSLGAIILGLGILSDIRARFYPMRGVGIFFGTFNPFHLTHVAIVKKALKDRGLSKVYIHPTVIPRLHAMALERGEIRVARVEAGLQVMEKTATADSNANYFPTGNRFYPPETRRLMTELAIAEAGLADKVEVLWLPDVYKECGFYGIIDHVKQLHPRTPIHGLHGSDLGGMWVRGIYDESGWIYPMPVRRRDGISATAIRLGATGMTASVVTRILIAFQSNATHLELNGHSYAVRNGNVHLQPEEIKT